VGRDSRGRKAPRGRCGRGCFGWWLGPESNRRPFQPIRGTGCARCPDAPMPRPALTAVLRRLRLRQQRGSVHTRLAVLPRRRAGYRAPRGSALQRNRHEILGFVAGDNAQHQGDAQARVTHVRAEVERVLVEAEQRVRSADRNVGFWTVIDIALGFPAAVLAGISGAAGLASSDARVPAAVLALVSAGFSAGAGFLRSDIRRAANRRSRLAWAEVEARARLLLAQETQLDREAIQEALRNLFASRTRALATHIEDVPGGVPS
jgi:hypothetical protein